MVLKDFRFLPVITCLFLLGFPPQAFSADIEWKLFVKPHNNSDPILSKTTREGEELIFKESEFKQVPSESQNIVDAFDRTSFLLEQSPSTNTVSIHIILNVDGNAFESIGGVSLFINLSFEAYINGEKENFITFDRAPMVMTIPQTGLNSLLSLSGLSRDNLICVYNSGGEFTDEGIESTDSTSRFIVKMNKLSHTVGGSCEDLGIESKVKVDTWSKIKLLFR